MKTFTIVGKSTLGQQTKIRVANGTIKARTAVLAREAELDQQMEDASVGLDIEVELEEDSELDFNNTASPIHY